MSQHHDPTKAALKQAGGVLLEARHAALAGRSARAHDLEPVATLDDVLFINDSRATFLDASLASFALLDRRVVWITGAWSDDMAEGHVQELLHDRVSAVIFFCTQAEGPMPPAGVRSYQADDLRMAVFLSRELASPGEVVLFSPACPSGNGFANYEERGAEFKRAVRDL